MGTTDQVRTIIAPHLEERGLDLYDVELTAGTLRLLVDREGGIDLDALSELTKAVSRALDAADPLPGRYTLEVSSPGLERPLRVPHHFAAAVGRRVRVKTVPGSEGDRRVEGVLVAADDDGVVIDLGGEERRLAHSSIERARTVFEWGPAMAGRPKGAGRRGAERKATRS